jgi:branched-chain amino acid transport system ATP-binding protein
MAMAETERPLLETRGLTKNFGGVAAVTKLDWSIPTGGIHGLIGPNGAGKSTVFNLVSGLIPLSAGQVFFEGSDITGMPAHDVVSRGMARTFQTTRLFRTRDVLSNVITAKHLHSKEGFWADLVSTPKARSSRATIEASARDLLGWVGLAGREKENAGGLPLREQKLLALAMALALKPRLVLLDEPTAGLDQTETAQARAIVRRVWEELGITVVIIEHKMRFVMELCGHVVVLNQGRLLVGGTPDEVCNDSRVIEAYLGDAARTKRM